MGTDWVAITAVGTWVLAMATWWMAWKQKQISQEQMRKQVEISREQLKVNLHVKMEDRFDNAQMIIARNKLAEQLLSSASHDEIQEEVMNFFETIGSLLSREYLDEDLAYDSFSYYGTRWWSACKDYIMEERRRKGDDQTIFEEFQDLVDTFYKIEMKERGKARAELEPSRVDIETFLREEKNLEW